MAWIIFIKLLLAHVIGDFVLQPRSWVESKQTKSFASPHLYLHTSLHAGLAYLFVMEWTLWQIPLAVFVSHTLIDVWKSYREKNLMYFVIDQFLHTVTLFALFLVLSGMDLSSSLAGIETPKMILIVLAYVLVWRPYAFVIDMLTFQWRQEIRAIEKRDSMESLDEAGKYIGILERVLVLTFILSNNPGAIGMLIAAKSILRFNDLKGESSRKMSEYVLIGTLSSFTLCIITGLAVKYVLTFL